MKIILLLAVLSIPSFASDKENYIWLKESYGYSANIEIDGKMLKAIYVPKHANMPHGTVGTLPVRRRNGEMIQIDADYAPAFFHDDYIEEFVGQINNINLRSEWRQYLLSVRHEATQLLQRTLATEWIDWHCDMKNDCVRRLEEYPKGYYFGPTWDILSLDTAVNFHDKFKSELDLYKIQARLVEKREERRQDIANAQQEREEKAEARRQSVVRREENEEANRDAAYHQYVEGN